MLLLLLLPTPLPVGVYIVFEFIFPFGECTSQATFHSSLPLLPSRRFNVQLFSTPHVGWNLLPQFDEQERIAPVFPLHIKHGTVCFAFNTFFTPAIGSILSAFTKYVPSPHIQHIICAHSCFFPAARSEPSCWTGFKAPPLTGQRTQMRSSILTFSAHGRQYHGPSGITLSPP